MKRNMELLELATVPMTLPLGPHLSSIHHWSTCRTVYQPRTDAILVAQVALQDEFLERVVEAAARRILHSTRVLPFVHLRVTCASADRSH